VRLIVRAYKGEEAAPFMDSKGPIHWLLPAGLWYANGWLNEALARTPFALASVLMVPLMFALGRRMNNGRNSIGLLAAGFVAMNGFYVSLARHVENRVLIVFWGVLALWFAYRYYTDGRNPFLLYSAITLAVALIAHPTVIFYVPAVLFIVGVKLWRDNNWRQQGFWLAGAAGLFMGLAALFYLPYLLGPDIQLVVQYFAEDRVGTSFLYNRVDSMLGESELYNSRYYGPMLVLLLTWLLGRNFAQVGRRGLVTFGVLVAAILTTAFWPDFWIVGPVNVAFIPYAILTLLVLLLPRTGVETKTNMLWFAVPFGGLLFLAQDASNHIQISYTGLALLAAFGLADLWQLLSQPAGQLSAAGRLKPALKIAIVVAFILIIPLTISYQYLSFNAPVTTYWQAKEDYTYNPNSIYTYLYGTIPRPRKVISNPRLGGWKAVGYLWEQGALSGDFRSINESFAVPIWYTFQTPRSCYTDPDNYWLRRNWQRWPDKEPQLQENGYTLTRVVLVDNQPKLHLYQRNVPPGEPEIIDMEAYRHLFDQLATPARFARDRLISQPASMNFGDKLLLRGYDLPETTHPGELMPVTVYWDALAPMDIRYRAFVHLVGPEDSRWGQHDDDPACRLLTSDMRPGQQSSRQFRVPVDPGAPPGEYSVILGIYHPDSFERLDIWDNQTQTSPGNFVVLGTVQVE